MPSAKVPSTFFFSVVQLKLSIILLFLFCFTSCYSTDHQVEALLAWKRTLKSQNPALDSWVSSDSSPCGRSSNISWFGIHCNSNGEVVEISLRGVDLHGSSLPSNLQSLAALKSMVFSSTNLTGEIPREFGEYRELSYIDLSDNSLSGEIPVEICGLSKLERLALNTNLLEGGIPYEIGNLSRLVYLTLYDNQISGEVPISIGKLSRLQVFRAGGNQNLKGELPAEIGNCTSLVMLGLAETSVSGSLPSSIGMLKRIQTISMYTSFLSGYIPEEIGNCSELRNLYLYQNSLSGSIPARIGLLHKLQNLLLWQNSLVGAIPYEFGNCRELTVIDLSVNLLTEKIPTSFGDLLHLQQLLLSVNKLSGTIPVEISNCIALTHLEVDNNGLTGEIPPLIGNMKGLTLFFAWHNSLTGKIPESLSACENLQALDLSYNNLFGSIPNQIFSLRNLTKLLLLSNDLSGFIPPDIGNCRNLYRLRLNDNRLGGTIPSEIGGLKSLNFMDLSNNSLVGPIPLTLYKCASLEFIDLHSNGFIGSLPEVLPHSLQFVDISDNRLTGPMFSSIGSLSNLSKLVLRKNQLSGQIPSEILSCSKLILLDLGENRFFGEIPSELGRISGLEISLNLSCNQFSGKIPSEFSGLTKLGNLDLSHNHLTGDLNVLATLENLVSLNISFNDFSGELPNTPFFRKLPLSDLTGNRDLYISNGIVTPADNSSTHGEQNRSTMRLELSILLSTGAVLVLLATYMLVRVRMASRQLITESSTWELTFYQKLEFPIEDLVRNLTPANVIGTGSSGVVYKVEIPNAEIVLAVKKMWSPEETNAFRSEIQTLGAIRHKNIVRLLGYGSNQSMKLLFYDYLPNGSLSSLLHGTAKGDAEWETRYGVLLGVAHALAYLHHDCVPSILHGDVKAMNVLLGSRNEPYLADFGLARTASNNGNYDGHSKHSQKPHNLAGSYGYMAPGVPVTIQNLEFILFTSTELASMQNITEKSDVYSYGVLLLEVLTGRHPLDPTLPGGTHLVQWARDHLSNKQDPVEIIDPKIRGRTDPQMHEMLQTLAVSFLCISTRSNDRPIMKDVVAMLKEIRHVEPVRVDIDMLKGSLSAVPSSSPSRKVASQGSSNCSFAFSDDSV